jgi:hypothetical protein
MNWLLLYSSTMYTHPMEEKDLSNWAMFVESAGSSTSARASSAVSEPLPKEKNSALTFSDAPTWALCRTQKLKVYPPPGPPGVPWGSLGIRAPQELTEEQNNLNICWRTRLLFYEFSYGKNTSTNLFPPRGPPSPREIPLGGSRRGSRGGVHFKLYLPPTPSPSLASLLID